MKTSSGIFGILIAFCIIMILSSVAAAEENIKDWYPKAADIRKKKCDDEHRQKTDNTEQAKEDSLREYVLCVAKELNVYSKQTGLNLKRLSQLTFAKGHIDFRTGNYLINSCNDKYKEESEDEVRFYKIIRCAMDEYHKIFLKSEM